MRILGVTGGIGSGKSTVCNMLARRGARVFFADEVARELMVADGGVRRQLVSAFGSKVYLADGLLDRSYLAGRIFSSEKERERINTIVHPAVARSFTNDVEVALTEGISLFVKEAALLFETDTSVLDSILVVNAPEEDRIRRVCERDVSSREHVIARLKSQMSPGEMIKRADYVIENDGSIETLQHHVDELFSEIVTRY